MNRTSSCGDPQLGFQEQDIYFGDVEVGRQESVLGPNQRPATSLTKESRCVGFKSEHWKAEKGKYSLTTLRKS